MPLYNYYCRNCNSGFDVFLSYADYGKKPVFCPRCGSENVRRCISRLRVMKSEDSRMESLADDFSDPAALAGLENDPKAMGRMMRKMGQELGEEMPPEFGDVVDRLEKGQSPEDIEREMPDMGTGDTGIDQDL